jgi:hypothetical protein
MSWTDAVPIDLYRAWQFEKAKIEGVATGQAEQPDVEVSEKGLDDMKDAYIVSDSSEAIWISNNSLIST